MHRRELYTLLTVCLLAGTPAMADYSQDVVRQLNDMGFTNVEVSRTLLGRVRITATGEAGQREIILNPRTGEILRDLWIKADGSSSDPSLLADGASGGSGGVSVASSGQDNSGSGSGSSGGSGNGSSGSGSGSSDDDDDDDDDGSQDSGGSDDDNSGGGGSNGGSGGSGGGSGGGSDDDDKSGGDDSSGGEDD